MITLKYKGHFIHEDIMTGSFEVQFMVNGETWNIYKDIKSELAAKRLVTKLIKIHG